MIALVALVFIGTFAYLFKRSQPKETVYQELTPTRGDVVKTTVVTGKIQPRDEVNVKAQISGIVFSVLILAGVELAMTTDGVLKAAFQVPFGTAVLAALLLTVLGVLAGLMPALRAMQIKPVDAMRDE